MKTWVRIALVVIGGALVLYVVHRTVSVQPGQSARPQRPPAAATAQVSVPCDADQDDGGQIMSAAKPNTTVMLGSCTYYLKNTIALGSGVTLQGASRTGTIIRPVNAQSIDCIDRKSSSGGEETHLTIRLLTITACDRTVYLGDGGVFTQVTSTNNNVGVQIGGYSSGTYAQQFGDDVQITNSKFTGNDEFGIFGKAKDSSYSPARPVIGNNILIGNGDGPSGDCGNNHDPTNCAQTKFITSPANPTDGGILVCGNKMSNSIGPNTDGNGVWFDVVDDQHIDTGAFVQGNTIWGNDGDGIRIEVTDGVTVGGTGTVNCAGKTLGEGNVVYNNQGMGIQVINADNATVVGNSVNCLGATGPGVPIRITYNGRTNWGGPSNLFSVTNNHVIGNSVYVRNGDYPGYEDTVVASSTNWHGNKFTGNKWWVNDSSNSGHWKCPTSGDCGDNSTSNLDNVTETVWKARGQDGTSTGSEFHYGASTCGTAAAPTAAATVAPLAAVAGVKVAAAGDIAKPAADFGSDKSAYTGQRLTAAAITAFAPDKIFVLGDNAYDHGSLTEYNSSFKNNNGTGGAAWGDFSLKKVLPIPGNHEYGEVSDGTFPSGATGYRAYFPGTKAPATGRLSYITTVGDWTWIMVDSEQCVIDIHVCNSGGALYDWLDGALASRSLPDCVGVAWHHPLFASGDAATAPMHDLYALVDDQAGADLILNGHEHLYERFARQDADGTNSASAPREFIVGTGGAGLNPAPSSWDTDSPEHRIDHGILKLRLRAHDYDFQFQSVDTGYTDGWTTSTCDNPHA